MVITFLHKFVRKYSRYYLSFLEKLLCSIMPNCFRLTFRSSTEHYSFWNPALTLAGFAHFSLSVWIKTTLHWTFSFIFTTIFAPRFSTGKFPQSGVLSTYAPTQKVHLRKNTHRSWSCRSYCQWSFLVFQLGLVADFSVGLWFGFG